LQHRLLLLLLPMVLMLSGQCQAVSTGGVESCKSVDEEGIAENNSNRQRN
jgi:hypothetical protein